MKTKQRKTGFTIVELLTVMAVIAMLMGILVPALNLVRKLAKDVNQRAEFHSINVALETYVNESPTQKYPESKALNVGAGKVTVGAQRLTEALLGRDLVGFDPNSTWDAYADELKKDVYASKSVPKTSSTDQVNASLARREGPYLNPANAEVFQIYQLFGDVTLGYAYPGSYTPAPVLTDIYRVKNVVSKGKTVMAGTPILYYKADTTITQFPDVNDTSNFAIVTPAYDANSIYSSIDNEELVRMRQIKNQALNGKHYFDPTYSDGTHDGRWLFYKAITDRKITTQARPYNMTSYILISAGADGIYGTRDDIYNFQ
jgi:prepilin-type N-terminal cleavage/methylation domain-containing protein